MFVQQKMMAAPNADANQKTMMYVMNVFFLFLFYSFPSGLNLYYFVFNLLSIIQQKYFMPKPVAAAVGSQKMMNGDATFVAPATPYGHSGLAVVRINGPESLAVVQKLAPKIKGDDRKAVLSKIHTTSGELIDECVVTYFKSPKSYTGDDMVEISCHGSPSIVDILLEQILSFGVSKSAEPGEFTKRAFLNGKIDLIQSEAIASLIQSKPSRSAKINSNTLDGLLSKKLKLLSKKQIVLLGEIEHALDISEEEVSEKFLDHCRSEISTLKYKFDDLLSTYNVGKLLNDGICVTITGKPNVGKSTLLNQLSGLGKSTREQSTWHNPRPG